MLVSGWYSSKMTKRVYEWKYFSFKICILLLMKTTTIQSTCKWEVAFGPVVCILRCSSNYIYVNGSYTQGQSMAQIEDGFADLTLCQDEGIRLELKNYASPSFVVRANSFTANIKVNDLDYSLVAISEMEANSLNGIAFKLVSRLVFTNTSITTFRNGLFNGLESVEKIHFKDVIDANLTIEMGVLDVLNRTLTEFTFEQSARTSNEIVIDGFTGGSAKLSQLTAVKYMYNLKNSITNKSFVGLEMVRTLDLSNCQIETFGVGSFDPISNSIETLKLGNNFITTLPSGIFDRMLPSHYTNIYLAGNTKWICECDLVSFKVALMEHSSNFVGTVECNSPLLHKGLNVTETNFCEPTTTTEVTTEITTEEITNEITTPLPHEFPQECFQPDQPDWVSEIITIQGPDQKFSIILNESVGMADVVLQIDVPMENRILIWFSLDDNITKNVREINCLMTSSSSIQITNLTENSKSPYIFCLINYAETTISPLDCISYATRDSQHKQLWISERKKGLVIGLTTIICCLCIVVGFASGCVALKVCANRDTRPDAAIGITKTQDRLSVRTSDINTVSQTAFDSNESAPPLPPRPSYIPINEYTYATVQ